jgi:hypothetical protein
MGQHDKGVSMSMLTARSAAMQLNRILLPGNRYVIAEYYSIAGRLETGRITQARSRKEELQGKLLKDNRWVTIVSRHITVE